MLLLLGGILQLNELQEKYPGSTTFIFGDSEELCRELIRLVRIGKKLAACSALRDIDSGVESMPEVGQRSIALNWDGTLALVIETVSISQRRFCDVDETFALAEGENDTLEGWRTDHQEFFGRNGGFDPTMMLVCERFRLIEDLSHDT